MSNIFVYSKLCKKHVLIKYIIVTTCLLFCSRFVAAEQYNYGPRFEIGIGSGLSKMLMKPEWSSEYYYTGSLNYAYRIIYGLSVQGGKNLGLGNRLENEWYEYGTNLQVDSAGGTFRESSWMGLRYEIPMSLLKKDYKKIHAVYVSGGISWDEFAFNSKSQKRYETDYGWQTGKSSIMEYNNGSYKTADLKGYYIAAAARWRFNTVDTDEEDSWLGSYGLDFGLRYIGYYNSDVKYDNIMPVKSNFGYYQIFVVGFLKIKFLY
ncbi:hypothetical protein ACFL6H_03015 [Candidatus Latescibacterota bacterium]